MDQFPVRSDFRSHQEQQQPNHDGDRGSGVFHGLPLSQQPPRADPGEHCEQNVEHKFSAGEGTRTHTREAPDPKSGLATNYNTPAVSVGKYRKKPSAMQMNLFNLLCPVPLHWFFLQ